MTDADDHGRFLRLDAAFRAGDFEALQSELGGVPGFPNVDAHLAMGSCLVYAIYWSPRALIERLLEAGADANFDVGDGFPPLMATLSAAVPAPGSKVRSDTNEVLALLLKHGARPGQRGINDYTPLHLAAAQGNLEAVELLLAKGADPNEITRIDNLETPVEIAEAAGHTKVVERLRPLTHRLDWDRAVKAGDLRTIERMLVRGHDINARDGFGQTALMRAAHSGDTRTVEWLIERGAVLDHASKYGLSALMLAVVGGHVQSARVLAKAGADLTRRGSGAPGFAGKTAADLAEERGEIELAQLLRKLQVRPDRR